MYLPELLSLAVALLEGGVAPLLAHADGGGGHGGTAGTATGAEELEEGAREIRSRSLRLVAATLQRFPAAADYRFLWGRLLGAAAPLLPRLAAEAAADKAPPLVELAAALAASQHLAPVLADGCSCAVPAVVNGVRGVEAAPPAEAAPCREPWASSLRRGSGLLAACVGAMAGQRCSEATRGAMLGALESLFDLPDPLAQQVLGPHMPALLLGLQSIVVSAWQATPGSRPSRRPVKGSKPAGPRTATASRALAILELVGSRAASWEAAQQLTDALLPLLLPREGGRRRGGRGEEALVGRALAALAALWSRLPPAELAQRPAAREQLLAVAAALAPLAGGLTGRGSRAALCDAFAAVAALLPEFGEAAALLADLNAMSATEVRPRQPPSVHCFCSSRWPSLACPPRAAGAESPVPPMLALLTPLLCQGPLACLLTPPFCPPRHTD
jgi:U3 small nucleolar RNA-associated protein 20